jgi:hypothetical protein
MTEFENEMKVERKWEGKVELWSFRLDLWKVELNNGLNK